MAITYEEVMEKLKECYDPEIPVNIVDLGLIYDVKIENNVVNVKMTLTAVGCPMSAGIAYDVKSKLLTLPDIKDANVEIVWDPPWNPDMMSDEAKKILGFEPPADNIDNKDEPSP
ncbi:MAG: metal-sulfur cluster assembly factor [Planctomycetota bacterium]